MITRRLDYAADPAATVAEAAALLRGGGLVAFPTETVYGLGALGLDPAALARIFAAKERPESDPVILHVAAPGWVEGIAAAVPDAARRLMEAFWPGPLTLVLPRGRAVPLLATAGLDSVAVRMPAHPAALALIAAVGSPLAAPSANLFSRPSPTTADHVLEDLDGRIAAVLDAGPTPLGVESTVLDTRPDPPVLLRPGGVSVEAIARVLGRPPAGRSGPSVDASAQASPGLLSRHYSPRAPLRLFDGRPDTAAAAMRALAEREAGPLTVLAYTEDLPALAGLACDVADLGSVRRPEEAASRLYALLRAADARGARLIIARLLPPGGLADAVNDRLRRAAAGCVEAV